MSETTQAVLTGQGSPYAELDAILEEAAVVPGSLIPVLQTVQERYGYLPTQAMDYIAKRLDLPPAKVYGVATFYAQFRLNPVGRYVLMLCKGTACHVNGANEIADALSELLGIGDGETTANGLFTIERVACLGCCSLAPAMMVQGDWEGTFGNLTPEALKDIIAQLRAYAEGGNAP